MDKNLKHERMKKMIFTLALALVCGSAAFAQNCPNAQNCPTPQKKVRQACPVEVKVKRMSERLMLDDSQAAQFAPLYKEYLEAQRACCNPEACPLNGKQELTDQDRMTRIEQRFEKQEQQLKIRKEYYGKFKKILNPKQLEVVFSAPCKKCHNPKGFHHKRPKGDPRGKYCPQGGPSVINSNVKK